MAKKRYTGQILDIKDGKPANPADIKPGNRNLIRLSGNWSEVPAHGKIWRNTATYQTCSIVRENTLVWLRIIATDFYYGTYSNRFFLKKNTKYTVQFKYRIADDWYKNDWLLSLHGDLVNGNWNGAFEGGAVNTPIPYSEFATFQKTFTTPATFDESRGVEFRVSCGEIQASEAQFDIAEIMLAEGTHVSWQPAPEDFTPIQDFHKLQAKADKSAAITDKYGTTVDGGLVQTVTMLLREANSETVTAGISGLQGAGGKPAFWAGGTWEQALAGVAQIIFSHNGGGKIGVFQVDNQTGRVRVYDKFDSELVRLLISSDPIPSLNSLMDSTTTQGEVILSDFSTSGAQALQTKMLPETLVVPDNAKMTISGSLHLTSESIYGASVRVILYRLANSEYTVYSNVVYFRRILKTTLQENFSTPMENLPAGTYKIGLEYEIQEAGSILASILKMAYVSDEEVRRLEMGGDGFMMFYSKNGKKNYLHMTEDGGIQVGGKIDMPGVLLSGVVSVGGGFASVWGAKQHATNGAVRISAGYYYVYHNVGHGDYSVQITPHANRTFYVSGRYNNFFTVYFYNGSTTTDTEFSFTIFGRNY